MLAFEYSARLTLIALCSLTAKVLSSEEESTNAKHDGGEDIISGERKTMPIAVMASLCNTSIERALLLAIANMDNKR